MDIDDFLRAAAENIEQARRVDAGKVLTQGEDDMLEYALINLRIVLKHRHSTRKAQDGAERMF